MSLFALPVPPAAAVLRQVRPIKNFDTGSTTTGFYKEFAAHFADGNIPPGNVVQWRKGNGTTIISSQADNFVYWGSGALRAASFTMFYPATLPPNGSDTLRGYAVSGVWNNASWATTSVITARDIRAEITISGVTYTLGANNEVTRGTNIKQIRSGPLSATWRIWGEFRNGTTINATAQGNVWGILYLTFFSDGTHAAWATIENGKSTAASVSSLSVSDYKLKDYVGPTTLFDYATSFTFYAGTPIDTVDTDGLQPFTGASVDKCVVGFPVAVLADPTTTGLYDSMATWWYKATATMIANISGSSAATYIPNSVGNFGNPDQTGGNDWIGPMTRYAVAAMLTGDWNSLRADRVNAFAGATAGTDYQDSVSGYPANLSANTYSGLAASTTAVSWGISPTITITGGMAPNGGGGGGSHAPLYAWYQYLATGQEPWLDKMQSQTGGFLGHTNPGTTVNYTRNPKINGANYVGCYSMLTQTRALAWNLRNVDNVQWVTPDTHVMKAYLLNIITVQFQALAAWVVAPNTPAGAATLGVYDGGEDGNGANSGWMHDYLAIVIAMSIRRGRIAAEHAFVAFHITPWVLGRAVNGCASAAYGYQIGLGQGATPAYPSIVYPTAWSQVYVGDLSDVGTFAGPITNYSGGGCPGSGVVVDSPNGFGAFAAGHTYPNIGECAAACAQIEGLTGGATNYTYLQAVESAAAISEATWGGTSTGPLWRIRVPA